MLAIENSCPAVLSHYTISGAPMSYIKRLANSDDFSAIQIILEGTHKQIRKVGAQIDTPFGDISGREIQLCLPDGSKYFVNRKALSIFFKTGTAQKSVIKWVISASESELKTAYSNLCELIQGGGDASILVIRIGDGPTALSCRIRVNGVVHPAPLENIYHEITPEKQIKSHTITIPVSALTVIGEQYYVSRWRLKKYLHQRKVIQTGEGWPDNILGGVWLEKEGFWERFFAPMIEVAMLVENADLLQKEQDRVKSEQELKQMELKRARDLEASKAYELKLKASKERSQAQKVRHMNSLETIQVQHVQWTEYITEKNQYGGKNKTLVTRSAENCTLKFSGQRVYIIFPEGHEIYKMRHNVKWSDS